MLLVNRQTKERLEVKEEEFKQRFKRELTQAFESYKQTQINKCYYRFNANDIEADFYFSLQWNFNHFGNSPWYIEKII